MSNIVEYIHTNQDRDGMLKRALERIIQLYTDKSHFVYELLQNAEDSEAHSIKFKQYADRLEVYHDGKPFTRTNLTGLCDIGKSDKINNLNQIGEFGVGFKSVFGICDIVELYSCPQNFSGEPSDEYVPFAVRINDFTNPVDIDYEVLESAYTTKFVFPYSIGESYSGYQTFDELRTALSSKLHNLGITTLLFMKNLEMIEYQIEGGASTVSGQYLLDKKIINNHCMMVSAIGETDHGNGAKEESISYLKFTRQLEDSPRTVDIAFPVIVKEDGSYECQKSQMPYVSVYFPTETESKLDFIVQGPFRTTPNRSSIPPYDEDNKRLASVIADLFVDSVIELRDKKILNLSFLNVFPLERIRFSNFGLFAPVFEAVKRLFMHQQILPTNSGRYVRADHAKLARQEKLTQILPDGMLSILINDGSHYSWLPTILTETNKDYKQLHEYISRELDVEVVRPENLKSYIDDNSDFLPSLDDDWIVGFYEMMEDVSAAFSKQRYGSNMLTSSIIKTSTGEFVPPYRKMQDGKYILNVFKPSKAVISDEIHFVDEKIYNQCQHFFDDIVQIQKVNEYEFVIKDIRKRYNSEYIYDENKHIEDVKNLIKYMSNSEYVDEVKQVISQSFKLVCSDGTLRNPTEERLYLSTSKSGINIEAYYRNIGRNIFFVNQDLYALHEIDCQELLKFNVSDSIIRGDKITGGQYSTNRPGRQPEWYTTGDFRWHLNLDMIKDVLQYISNHPSAKDSILKSKTILKTLFDNEKKLYGNVYISGSSYSNLNGEYCDLLKVLRGGSLGGTIKWLFTESGELVSQKEVSRHEIDPAIYGQVNADSKVYDYLGFKRTDADDVDALKKKMTSNQVDALFESELKHRFGISVSELNDRYGEAAHARQDATEEEKLEFPTVGVKSWDALKKHAAEMLSFADPVRYQMVVRSIRVSDSRKEKRAYLLGMYRSETHSNRFACQLCHDFASNIEAVELFENPEEELDPMNISLCPNCSIKYKSVRKDKSISDRMIEDILSLNDYVISASDKVALYLKDSQELWFTQTHIAEIRELINLRKTLKEGKVQSVTPTPDSETEKSGLAIYKSYIGKTIKRKIYPVFKGTIVDIVEDGMSSLMIINITEGQGAGQVKKYLMQAILGQSNYEIQ